MARNKTPDKFLSEEQKKRRERNERYYRLKKESGKPSQMGASPQLRIVSKNESELETKGVLKPRKPMMHEGSRHLRRLKSKDVSYKSQEVVGETGIGWSQSTGVLNKSQIGNEMLTDGNQYWAEWRFLKIILSSPAVFFSLLIILAVTSLLTYFQATVYLKEGFDLISWPLAIICELSLGTLAVFFAVGRYRKMALILFVGMFAYSLGTMSYDLRVSKTREIIAAEEGGEKNGLIASSLKQAQEALKVAIKREESGNISRHTKTVEELTMLVSKAHSPSQRTDLITYKYDGLIFLRALLMLINAFLVHFVITMVLGRRLLAGGI